MATVKQGNINAARILAALGRIGYHPVSAILDIVDNAVSAGATKIAINFKLTQGILDGSKTRTLIDTISILDNGKGMSVAGIDNALSLGSSEEFYEADSLSKFGLGLKSASSSLGKRLSVVSKEKGGKILTAVLDQEKLTSDYEYDLDPAAENDSVALNDHCGVKGSGTIIKIENIHHESMPRAIEIIEELKRQAGVIFYYYITGQEPAKRKVKFIISQDGNEENLESIDPLFLSDIDQKDGNLDERNWDGQSVKWIRQPQKFQLDDDGKVFATVEISQLPHPPSVSTFTDVSQNETRQKYSIGAGNYGFYIYRNGRLISWADSLNGRISQNQDLYSFRGRILIESSADDILNLDVTKSRIHLSEIAQSQLEPIVNEAKKKSMAAWSFASQTVQRKTDSDPHSEINAELDKFGDLEEKGIDLDEDIAPEKDKKKLKERRAVVEKNAPIKPEEAEKLEKQGQRVQYVEELDNNQLWERASDPKEGLIVRVNKSHSMYRELISTNIENVHLIRALDILFFALAKGEYMTLYRGEFDAKIAEKILMEYREQVGSQLAEILRQTNKNT